MTMLEYALKYAEIGFHVFPLKPGTKQPAITDNLNAATTDPDQIRKWWSGKEGEKRGIAVACGKKSGIVVLDFDHHPDTNGRDGLKDLDRWEAANGRLPDTWQVETGSGGMHLFYRSDDPEIRNHAKLGDTKGIDTRANGGYVVLPPTIHQETGRPYKWRRSPWKTKIAPYEGKPEDFISEQWMKDEGSTESFEAPQEIDEGGRVDTLVRLIGSLKGKNLSEEAIRAAVIAENEAKCHPPLSDFELKHEVFPAIKRLKSGAEQGRPTKEPPKVSSLVCLSDIEEEEPEWLIKDYMPKYQITTLAGDGGAGKTTLWCNIAAAISTGKPSLLDGQFSPRREPGKVLFFSAEDSIKHTLKKRLREAGANINNIRSIDISNPDFLEVKFNSQFLRDILKQTRPTLCIFDPIQSFVPANIKMGERNAMRQALEPLIGFGEEFGTTFLIIVHANKMNGAYGRKRIADSADIWDISRSVLMAGEVPADNDDEGETKKYLSHEKCNYGRLQDTILYTLDNGTAKWAGSSTKKDRDFVLSTQFNMKHAPAKQQGADFILTFLDDGEAHTVKELEEYAKAMNITSYSLREAKKTLKQEGKIEMFSRGNNESKTWYLRSKS